MNTGTSSKQTHVGPVEVCVVGAAVLTIKELVRVCACLCVYNMRVHICARMI